MHIARMLPILVMTQAAALVAQPAPDTTNALAAAGAHLRALGTRSAPLWPEFRPDTIPIVLVLPGRGTALLNWPGSLPDGWTPFAGIPELERSGRTLRVRLLP